MNYAKFLRQTLGESLEEVRQFDATRYLIEKRIKEKTMSNDWVDINQWELDGWEFLVKRRKKEKPMPTIRVGDKITTSWSRGPYIVAKVEEILSVWNFEGRYLEQHVHISNVTKQEREGVVVWER